MDAETHSRLSDLARETGRIYVPSKQWKIFRSQLDPQTGVQDIFCKWRPGFFVPEDTLNDTIFQPKVEKIRHHLLSKNYHYHYDGE